MIMVSEGEHRLHIMQSAQDSWRWDDAAGHDQRQTPGMALVSNVFITVLLSLIPAFLVSYESEDNPEYVRKLT